MEQVFFALWFFLPVGLANSAPVFAMAIPGLKTVNYPMDFYGTFRGKRIFGSHKTFRGLIAGILVAILTVWLQQYLFVRIPYLQENSLLDYQQINPFVFGTVCAVGALFGDASKSFFKRQIGVKPGKTWFPFDQVDYIIGGILATAFYVILPVSTYLFILIIWFGMHLLSSWIGYLLGLKDTPI